MQNLKSKLKININLKTFYFLLVLLSFDFLFLNLDKAEAAALSLGINPPIITINAIPPTNVTSSLSIQNKSDTQVTLQIQIKPFKAKGENGEIVYSREALEILKNIRILDADISVESITLGPRQEKNLKLNIVIPQDTNISDYYFSIVFISTNTSKIESNSSINQIGIATNILLSVGAKETPKAFIEEFSSSIFFEKGPVPFTVRIKNTGVHFIKPKGEITIKNIFGQSIGKVDLTGANVLSNSIRAIPTALWKENFLLGLYTATLDISMSDEGPAFTRTIHFLAFPFQGLIIIVIIAIAVIIIRNRLKLYMTHSTNSGSS